MKAVRFHEYGDSSVLRYEDVEQPVPGAGQVLIRVAATSFNGVDGNIRAGFMQGPIPVTLPHTPGIDVSGTVKAAGADEVIDHTTTAVTAVTTPVDVVLNLAPIEPAQLDALLGLIRPGGVLVNTTVWMPAPSDEARGVRGIDLFVRSDAQQLS